MDGTSASFIFFLAVCTVCTLAVPVDNQDGTRVILSNFLENLLPLDIENNEVNYELFQKRNNEENQLDNSKACTDFYSYSCNKLNSEVPDTYSFNKNINNVFSLFTSKLKELINKENDHNIKSINIEQQLYRSCMRLGDNDKIYLNDVYNEFGSDYYSPTKFSSSNDRESNQDMTSIDKIFNNMVKKFNLKYNENNWQELDRKLASLGYGHAFFEINVVDDIENPNRNIIELKPPSIKEWNSRKFTDLLADMYLHFQLVAYEKCQEDLENMNRRLQKSELENDSAFLESSEEYEIEIQPPSCKMFKNKKVENVHHELLNNKDNVVTDFYNDILRAIFDSTDVSNRKPLYTKFRIKEWNVTYNEMHSSINKKDYDDSEEDLIREYIRDSARINWIGIFKNEFERVGIDISGDETVLVQNYPYFEKLDRLLRTHSDKLIAYSVRSKFVSENIRYYNWTWAEKINNIEKSSFCFEETKLYGVSEFALEEFKEKHLEQYEDKAQNVVHNILNVLFAEISKAEHLSKKQKVSLKSKLTAIVKPNIEAQIHKYAVSNYYGNFELTGDYFIDIKNYRTILKIKNLKNLHKQSPYTPLSFTDIENPRNRFILQTTLGAIGLKSIFTTPSVPYETYYAIYGVNVANFLYSLLEEKLFENDKLDRHGIQWLIPHPTYSSKYVQCFILEDVVEYHYALAYKTITEIFGLRFAYNAMLIDTKELTVNFREFFTAYTKMHCGTQDSKQMTKRVLSHFEEFRAAFECPKSKAESRKCHLGAF